ncbi:hypothetical protein CYFUS_009639 [Cystobacter fuscus]|uniref:Lipoprotein n=1 Tax=Cystobacter fuscus TaxID=43 RepID=A0A250JL05_9BACT|nr:hypothetical protein [Cystobacter fuscus]ATB44157.1 hypothetical protein CYFUS_009639 [Cystobacter fuscus]
MHKALALPALCLALASPAHAQEVTYEYTDMETCPRVVEKVELKPGEDEAPEGDDPPIECRGPGGEYSLVESYNLFDYFRDIRMKGDPNFSVSLRPSKATCPAARFGPKLEWRMKGGKPFAVIQRVTCYAVDERDGVSKHGKKLGEYLVVKGLKGYTSIDGEVPTKTKDANDKARAIADAGRQKH